MATVRPRPPGPFEIYIRSLEEKVSKIKAIFSKNYFDWRCWANWRACAEIGFLRSEHAENYIRD
jgi:hypothetical protein